MYQSLCWGCSLLPLPRQRGSPWRAERQPPALPGSATSVLARCLTPRHHDSLTTVKGDLELTIHSACCSKRLA